MRKKTGLAIIVLFIASILIIGPWLTGIYFKRNYAAILASYADHGLKIDVLHYDRGWFCSTAKINVTIDNPVFYQLFNTFGIATSDIPKQYTINQRIQHGPLMYHRLDGLQTLLGIATIQNTLQMSPATIKLLGMLGANEHYIDVADDFIAFNRSYYKHIKLNAFHNLNANEQTQIQVKQLEGRIWIKPDTQKITGDIRIQHIQIKDEYSTMVIPNAKLAFDQEDSIDQLWLGTNRLTIPELHWHEITGKDALFTDIRFDGFINNVSGKLNGSRELTIKKIEVDNETLGPINLQLGIKQFNAEAVMSLYAAYRQIQQRGELYESQLRRKILMMLPTIVSPGASIALDKMNLATPDGQFNMTGEMIWPTDSSFMPENISDLLQNAKASIKLRVTKVLLDKWIHLAAKLPFFNPADQLIESAYANARENMYAAMRQNALMIVNLTDDHLISEADALNLLALQKNSIPLVDYELQINKLFLSKSINLPTSYQLFLGYLEVQRPLWVLAQILKRNQAAILVGLQEQLAEWIKLGYVKQEQNDYVISVLQKDGNVSINEKSLN